MKSPVKCKCTIGNKKKWRNQTVLHRASGQTVLKASLVDEANSVVEFSWDGENKWGDVVQQLGEVPLPPYINRHPEESDKDRYQTVYSAEPGAVAAPTAGLHFTNEILDGLKSRGVKFDFLTLHVGSGTFLPIKTDKVEDHNMHAERLVFSRENIDCLLNHAGKIIPVGTTSCRSLESLYWFGNKVITENCTSFNISQYDPFKLNPNLISRKEALAAVAKLMDKSKLREIHGSTSIFIYPSYTFKMTDSLVTNFHQPGSTLILLVAALIGNRWKGVYQEAINKDYRFLSYGDSSFLVP